MADQNQVKAKAVQGSISLLTRQGLSHPVGFIGNILLARLLIPEDFGIYVIVNFIVGFLSIFGDIGLGASLIQKHEEPILEDWRAIFTFQQILVAALVLIAFLGAPFIATYYHLSGNAAWLIRVMAVSLIITSFRTIPAMRLERHLEFKKLALIEVTETLLFQCTAVILAFLGFGVWSFIIGVVTRCTIGTALIYIIAPWPIGWQWGWGRIRSFMHFGLPYQGIGLVSFIKDGINPLFIGTLIGTAGAGYIYWAVLVSNYPLIILAILNRLFFSLFSRLQRDPLGLRVAIERVLRWNNLFALCLLAVLISQAREITVLIFGEKWLPVVPLLYLLGFGNFFVASSYPLLALLNALGKSNVSFTFHVVWMVGTWAFGVPLIKQFGLIGFGISNMLVQLTNLALFGYTQRVIPFRMMTSIGPSLVSFFFAVIVTLGVKQLIPFQSLVTLIVLAAVTILLYIGCVLTFWRKDIIQDTKLVVKVLWPKLG